MHIRFFILAALLLVSASATNAAIAPDSAWPQWRGPTRDGQFTGRKWPEQLDTNHFQRTWRVASDEIFIRELNALAALRWTRELEPNAKGTQP